MNPALMLQQYAAMLYHGQLPRSDETELRRAVAEATRDSFWPKS